MAGYTGIVVGKVDERCWAGSSMTSPCSSQKPEAVHSGSLLSGYVMLPNHAITKAPARREFNQ
jgi:hypothetical protein